MSVPVKSAVHGDFIMGIPDRYTLDSHFFINKWSHTPPLVCPGIGATKYGMSGSIAQNNGTKFIWNVIGC